MRPWLCNAVAALAVLIAGTQPACADDLKAQPQWSSDRIRAGRPLGPENAVVFTVTRTDAGGEARTQTVTLATDFTEIVDGPQHHLYDHALCRDLSWSDPATGLNSTSCYAVPAFRVFEMQNRLQISAMLKAVDKDAAAKADVTQPFWAETELGVQLTPSSPLARQASGDDVSYQLGLATVVRESGVAAQLDPADTRALVRYLALDVRLHPQVRRDIAKTGKLFQRIEIDDGQGRRTILAISGVARVMRPYPLPPGLASTLELTSRAPKTVFEQGVAEAIRAIDGQSSSLKPSMAAILSGIDQANADRQPMRVLFLFFELSQQYTAALAKPESLAEMRKHGAAVQAALADPAVARLFQANSVAGGQGGSADRQAAARDLMSAKLDGIPFATFRNVTFANLVRSSGDVSKWDQAIFASTPKALTDNYWIHIKAYPWASNAYADAGRAYLEGYDMANAWLSFDLGRAVDPDWRTGAMAGIGELEDRLRRDQPDDF